MFGNVNNQGISQIPNQIPNAHLAPASSKAKGFQFTQFVSTEETTNNNSSKKRKLSESSFAATDSGFPRNKLATGILQNNQVSNPAAVSEVSSNLEEDMEISSDKEESPKEATNNKVKKPKIQLLSSSEIEAKQSAIKAYKIALASNPPDSVTIKKDMYKYEYELARNNHLKAMNNLREAQEAKKTLEKQIQEKTGKIATLESQVELYQLNEQDSREKHQQEKQKLASELETSRQLYQQLTQTHQQEKQTLKDLLASSQQYNRQVVITHKAEKQKLLVDYENKLKERQDFQARLHELQDNKLKEHYDSQERLHEEVTNKLKERYDSQERLHEEEINKLKERIDSQERLHEQEINKLKSELIKYFQEIEQNKGIIAHHEILEEEFQEKLDDKQEEMVGLKAKLTEAESSLAIRRGQLASKDEVIQSLKASISNAEVQLSEAQQREEHLQTEHKKILSENSQLKAKNEELLSKLAERESQKQQLVQMTEEMIGRFQQINK